MVPPAGACREISTAAALARMPRAWITSPLVSATTTSLIPSADSMRRMSAAETRDGKCTLISTMPFSRASVSSRATWKREIW
jgi:hypothetical protein